MKFKHYLLLLFGLFLVQSTAQTQNLVEDFQVDAQTTKLKMSDLQPDAYQLEIAGPDNYYWSKQMAKTPEITLTAKDEYGNALKDGNYKLQISPVYFLSQKEQTALRKLLNENDLEGAKAFRASHQIPSEVTVYNISYSIKEGAFVEPTKEEIGKRENGVKYSFQEEAYQSLFAHVREKKVNVRPVQASYTNFAKDNTQLVAWDQIFQDDI